jgi:hypothetical protein
MTASTNKRLRDKGYSDAVNKLPIEAFNDLPGRLTESKRADYEIGWREGRRVFLGSEPPRQTPAFEVFRFMMRTFLAIPYACGNVGIIGSNGDNFGSWFSVDSFKKHHKAGAADSLGKARLVVQVLP